MEDSSITMKCMLLMLFRESEDEISWPTWASVVAVLGLLSGVQAGQHYLIAVLGDNVAASTIVIAG